MKSRTLFFGFVAGAMLIMGAALWSTRGEKAPQTSESPDEASRQARLAEQISTWPKTPEYVYEFDALNPLRAANIDSDGRPIFDPSDDYWGLPRSQGYELVDVYCSGCHSLQVVMQQRASTDRWHYMLDWMSEKQNMAPLPEEDEAIVVAYLSRHFGN